MKVRLASCGINQEILFELPILSGHVTRLEEGTIARGVAFSTDSVKLRATITDYLGLIHLTSLLKHSFDTY